MTPNGIKEDILSVFMDEPADLKSPYGLYGFPEMWNLFSVDGITFAARPTRVMDRQFEFGEFVEIDGISWGQHRDGQWLSDIQHRASSYSYFITNVLTPAIAGGAVLRDGLLSELREDRQEPGTDEIPSP